MDRVNQELLDYIKEEVNKGLPAENIKRTLLINDWSESTVTEAFSQLGIETQNNNNDERPAVDETPLTKIDSFEKENITMDKIIEKFIPITGALMLIIGFGYLIYANAWVNLSMEVRLALGFFFSLAIIGGSFSFAEKMRYFADIGIGSGVLLLYGTLIYGSRTTELATAMIPEIVTLITAVIFTVAISYFASKRNSKVILVLGMIGAYITPFVIGQNSVWVENVSFNAYLIYFFAVNLAIFLMGREISVRDIIPLNILGLFIGVSTLWNLSSSDGINAVGANDFFSGEIFTSILFAGLVIFSVWSILLSAKRFSEKDDGYLSLGYVAPIVWFIFNIENLQTVPDAMVGSLYALIAAACFAGWHYLSNIETKLQHTAIYAAGLLSVFLAVFSFFEEFDVFTSMVIAYSSLIFATLYLVNSEKSERFISYILVSLIGSILSLVNIVDVDPPFATLLIVIALLPAIATYFIAKHGRHENLVYGSGIYSILWSIIAFLFVAAEFIDYLDTSFVLFYFIPLGLLVHLAYVNYKTPDKMPLSSKSRMLRMTLAWFAFGFYLVFLQLVVSIYPAPTDAYLFTNRDAPTDWLMIKGVFATVILFVGLFISRKLQLEQVIKRPSFILVIFGYATLLLTGNYIISAIANDISVSMEHGGPRAIATTLWWATIAIYMLYKGVKFGQKYHPEKLLGLILLGITLVKIILYDISNMGMQNKIIVLMIVGGAMLMFSYVIKSKNLLKTKELPSIQ